MKNLRKKIRRIRKEYGMHLGYSRPNDLFMGPPDVYEEARQNKAFYDECRQNVINGERAEHMRKSLFWLGIATLLSGATFCWCVTWRIFKLGEWFIMPALILIGLAFVSTGVHLWYERKIKKLVNVK